ncbi:zinc ABC transporter substrate-binding protein [Epibacterium sp. MM17-32]|uniref:zinc ABC transporter substrate-binding protein n=1 Tax=Epibacterium sp. MM17-32 TaxID=2917734 RepID=UPI001EF583B5|nr:zinc ABC transporter substrate-binding protein [Epibacterium sp. MM17-32]MCG7629381.1 zinc ABC transporter substrate-binding protein [Epibacterium sp. MM17-32]
MLPKSLTSAVALSILAFPVAADAPKVVTDIAPIQGLVARVMAGVGEPAVLVPPGASPHGYSLRPSNARDLSNADAVFWVGEALAPWLEEPITQLTDGVNVVSLLNAPGTMRLDFRQGAVFAHAVTEGAHEHDEENHDHDHEAGHDGHDHGEHAHGDHDDHDHGDHGHDHDDHGDHDHDAHAEHDHSHHDHAHDGVDPHAWLSPENGKHWLALIAEELSQVDPENASIYEANAIEGQAEIDQIVADLNGQLAGQDGQFVVFHDAFQYFEQGFGLKSLGAISLGDASDPSVSRIAEIRNAVDEAGVTCVFSEPQFNPGLVRTVTEGTDVSSYVIDPLGMDIETGKTFYADLLKQTGAAFVACLGD